MEMSGTGTLYAYTVALQAFHPYFEDKLPYVLALVELPEQPGLRLTTQIINCEEANLRIGMPLTVAWTEVGTGMTLPYFAPAEPTADAAIPESLEGAT
jgi:uncharacterized OB-fold protein